MTKKDLEIIKQFAYDNVDKFFFDSKKKKDKLVFNLIRASSIIALYCNLIDLPVISSNTIIVNYLVQEIEKSYQYILIHKTIFESMNK